MSIKRKLGILTAFMLLFSACVSEEDSYTQGVWERKSDFDGSARGYACSFNIGSYGYVFGGSTGKKSLRDLWVYDTENNYWKQCASLPEEGTERHDAVAFSVNGKGYITTGVVHSTGKYLNDTWEYNPDTDTWRRMDDFPGTPRYGALSFSIGGYGYVGAGKDEDNYLKDIYRFNPEAPSGSQWEIVTGYGGSKRLYATTFVIDDVAYICCGENNNSNVNDFWKFDGSSWTQLRDISNTNDEEEYDDDYAIIRSRAVAFIIDGQAYLVGGNSGGSGTVHSDYWVYNPDTDLWSGDTEDDFTPFEGSSRTGTVAISTGKRGFIVTGTSGSYTFDDVWELLPYELQD